MTSAAVVSNRRLTTSHQSGAILVGDIGGTNARFGWRNAFGEPIAQVKHYACSNFRSASDAVATYLRDSQLPSPNRVAIGVATSVEDDHVAFTNNSWSFNIPEFLGNIGAENGIVINDFVALASGIEGLRDKDVRPIGSAQAKRGAPMVVIGPGTGLGVATLIANPAGRYVPVGGEGGHATLAANSDVESAVIAELRKKFGHVSAERALCGQGLVELHLAIATIRGIPAETLSPADITDRFLRGGDVLCNETVSMFTEFLASMAANVALTVGAFGGVYIGGGIVPRLGERFDSNRFRTAFEAKGRFAEYLSRIPVNVIISSNVALEGAAAYLDHEMATL